MRCTGCSSNDLLETTEGLNCNQCKARYPVKHGIVDMLGDDPDEVITPFQRLMQTPLIVSIYEKIWRRAGYYLASSRSFSREMETISRVGMSRCTEHALDLACGTGVFSRPLAGVASSVVGLDLSWPMLIQAQRLARKQGKSNLHFIRATVFNLPFIDASFPYVNCCGALHLFDRPADALKEISRILKPGGFFCVQTTIRPTRSAGFAYFLERFIRFGFFSESEIKERLRLAGFDIIDGERHRISFTFLARRRVQ
jgi:ubiquinone/menaquinone biosynthesis C-methylase UbiE